MVSASSTASGSSVALAAACRLAQRHERHPAIQRARVEMGEPDAPRRRPGPWWTCPRPKVRRWRRRRPSRTDPPGQPAQRLGEAREAHRRARHVVHPDPRARHACRARRTPWPAGDRRRSAPARAAARSPPSTYRSSPDTSARQPTERRFSAIRPSRSLSFTRSSPTCRKTVVPSARAASTASRGISSISPGISPGRDLRGAEPRRPHDQIGHGLAEVLGQRPPPRPARPSARAPRGTRSASD